MLPFLLLILRYHWAIWNEWYISNCHLAWWHFENFHLNSTTISFYSCALSEFVLHGNHLHKAFQCQMICNNIYKDYVKHWNEARNAWWQTRPINSTQQICVYSSVVMVLNIILSVMVVDFLLTFSSISIVCNAKHTLILSSIISTAS